MNSKVYRIREKATGKFISLKRGKTSWLTRPNEAIKENKHIFQGNEDKYELVIFELIEISYEEIT